MSQTRNGPGEKEPRGRTQPAFDGTSLRHGADDEQGMRTLAQCLAELLADLEARQRRESELYADGYQHGYADGYEIGRAHAERDMAQAWHRVFQTVQAHARMQTAAETENRRWGGPREQFGRPRVGDFPGMCQARRTA